GGGGEEMVRRLSWDGGGCCGRGNEGNDVVVRWLCSGGVLHVGGGGWMW
nr:hypothetical protein [Tanacetum cinerariifolium]